VDNLAKKSYYLAMKQGADYITEGKRKDLEAELKDLKGPKRKLILEALEYAKSLGDLSENAEYHQTREDQGKLEERIAHIEQILRSSEVVSEHRGDVVEVGSKVTVEKEGGEKKDYQIVGSEEADMKLGKISNRSPFGAAIFGKKKGDKISFKTPGGGVVNYKIISVS